jgi:hypothetical protein
MAAVEAFYRLRGRIFLAPLEELKSIIVDNGIVVEKLDEIERGMAVKQIDNWLTDQVKGKDKGATALLSLKHYFEEAQPTVKPETEAEDGQSKPVKVESAESKVRYHREFKISGQIDLKAGISFTSLVRQVESGLKKGYPEIEVIDGVIRAIPASSGLRNYLESRRDLGLGTLRGILRAHYLEKSATELYRELGAAAQGQKESSSDFLMRILDIRNKIVFSSQEHSSELKYDPKLVHGLFVRTVDTGLQDQAVRQEFRSTLLKEGVQDEELIQELNQIVSRELERKGKLVHSVRKVEVQTVEGATSDADDHSTGDKSSEGKPKPVKEGILATELKELRAAISEIQSKLQGTSHSNSERRSSTPRYRQSGCAACQTAGTGDSCRHCWKCGSGEHFKSGCRAGRNNNELNG